MWSHYADNHSGVCVQYSFETVNNISSYGCIPIKYTNTYEYNLAPYNLEESVKNFLKLYSKSTEWLYEKEWRVMQQSEIAYGNGYSVQIGIPEKIYLGCRIKKQLKKDILEYCFDKDIDVYQMRIKEGTFLLYYEKIN